MRFSLWISALVVVACYGSAEICNTSFTFLCLNEKRFLRCSAVTNVSTENSTLWTTEEATCSSGQVCSCGRSSSWPCLWDHDVTPIDCEGYAGTEESRWNTDNAKSIDDTYSLMPSKHLSMAICFDKKKWLSQLGALLLSATYDKIDAHVAVGSNFMCSLHPNVHYDYNPTQLWLGFPEDVVPTDLSRGKRLRFLRLPDSMTGLTLGFLMDMYGINPGTLLALLTDESLATVTSVPSNFFVAPLFGEMWKCSETVAQSNSTTCDNYSPLTSDGGALQTSKTVLNDLVSIIPQRLKVPSAEGRPNNTKQPDYQSHQYFESNPNFDAYFAELSFAPLYKSLIVTALEMHAHHSPLFLFDCLGMRPIWNVLSRTSMDSLEFSFAIHAHKVGLFDTSLRYENVMQCLTSSNLTSKSFEQCVFSSTYTQIDRVRALCKIFDSSTLIYDYPIYWTDVELFITRLRSTYPFSTVEMHGTILWDTLSRDSLTAFQVLAEHRASTGTFSEYGSGPSQGAISLKYDWRALCAVIRMYLPASEILVGRTLQALAQRGRVSEDINYINPDWWPTSFGSFAGYNENVCPPAEITNSSSSEGQNGTVSNSSSAADESQYGTAISLPVAQSLTLILCICALLFV